MRRLALLFDLDGTLIDSIQLLLECMQHAFHGRERAPTTEQWIAGIGTPLRVQLAEWADDDAMVEALVNRYREYQELHIERLTRSYDGVEELLRWIRDRGHATAIVTSKGRGMTSRSLSCARLNGFFDVVVTVESTASHKPGPEPVLFALEQLGIGPGDAMFFGDSPHDMHSGRAAGVVTVACEWGPFSRSALSAAAPDHWAASPPELRPIIEAFELSNHGSTETVKPADLFEDHDRTPSDNATT